MYSLTNSQQPTDKMLRLLLLLLLLPPMCLCRSVGFLAAILFFSICLLPICGNQALVRQVRVKHLSLYAFAAAPYEIMDSMAWRGMACSVSISASAKVKSACCYHLMTQHKATRKANKRRPNAEGKRRDATAHGVMLDIVKQTDRTDGRTDGQTDRQCRTWLTRAVQFTKNNRSLCGSLVRGYNPAGKKTSGICANVNWAVMKRRGISFRAGGKSFLRCQKETICGS